MQPFDFLIRLKYTKPTKADEDSFHLEVLIQFFIDLFQYFNEINFVNSKKFPKPSNMSLLINSL